MRVAMLLLIATTGFGSISPDAIGQTPGVGRRPVVEQPTQPMQPSGPSVRVEFTGGLLDAFVAAVRAGATEPVNIVLQGGAERVPVSPMSLVDVSVEAALRAALEPRIGVAEVGEDGAVSAIQMSTIQTGPQMLPVFVVSRRSKPAQPDPMDLSTEVFSIQRLVMGVERDGIPPVPERVILEAIDAGLAISRREPGAKPEINYHKDSGLLLVHASTADVRLVQSVVKRLTDDYLVRASDAMHARRYRIERSAEMAKLEVKTKLAGQRVNLAESKLQLFRQLAEKGQLAAPDLAQAELALAEARAEYDLARIDFNRMMEEGELSNNVPAPINPDAPEKSRGR